MLRYLPTRDYFRGWVLLSNEKNVADRQPVQLEVGWFHISIAANLAPACSDSGDMTQIAKNECKDLASTW